MLTVEHSKTLSEQSGISEEIIAARGYRTATKKSELEELGFGEKQRRVPALVIPVHNVTGEAAFHQIRPDGPRANSDGKPIQYETPTGAKMALDVPPSVRLHLGNPTKPLFITEGVKKADAAASHELCCIALIGVWN